MSTYIWVFFLLILPLNQLDSSDYKIRQRARIAIEHAVWGDGKIDEVDQHLKQSLDYEPKVFLEDLQYEYYCRYYKVDKGARIALEEELRKDSISRRTFIERLSKLPFKRN